MSIYTKRGDRGITDMAHAGNISKSDDRIRLMGEADELNSHIELVKSMLVSQKYFSFLNVFKRILI
mgnify:CR=1 FL=1